MAIDFPDTTGQPTDGSFTHSEGSAIWTWDGEKWSLKFGVTSDITDFADLVDKEIDFLQQKIYNPPSTTVTLDATNGPIYFYSGAAGLTVVDGLLNGQSITFYWNFTSGSGGITWPSNLKWANGQLPYTSTQAIYIAGATITRVNGFLLAVSAATFYLA